jgi:hypothetical protein
MQCDDVESLAVLFADGELPVWKSGPLFEHLHDCAKCKLFFRHLIVLQKGIRAIPLEYPHGFLFDEIASGVRAAAPKSRSEPYRPPVTHMFWQRTFSMTYASGTIAFVMIVLWSLALALLSAKDPSADQLQHAPAAMRFGAKIEAAIPLDLVNSPGAR